jgi:glycine oxidase
MSELCLASRAAYPAFAKQLQSETGIDVGYRECGVLRVAFDDHARKQIARDVAWQKRQKLPLELLDRRALARLEPALSPKLRGGVRFARDARVEPRALLRALHIAAQGRGVRFQSGAFVRRVTVQAGRATGVELEDGSALAAGYVVVAAGSWTSAIDGLSLPVGAVTPARGQIVELELPAPVFQHVVFGPGAYLVPREDGKVLIGSTLEFVGHAREVTAVAVRDLLTAALALVPALEPAGLRSSWSNFRPYTKDHLPLLGPSPIERLVLATGHYRNGILLAPISAEIVRKSVLGQKLPALVASFSAQR